MVDAAAALLTALPMSDIPCSARLSTLTRVLTLVAVSAKASIALTCARRLSAKPRSAPCPAYVVETLPLASCCVRSLSWFRRAMIEVPINDVLPLTPSIDMEPSHGLDQRVVHLLDGRHHARVGGISVLQREQMRHLVVDIDAGGIAHFLLQCIQHHGLTVGELFGGGRGLALLADELLGEVYQRPGERRCGGPDTGLRRIAISSRLQLRENEVGASGVARGRQRVGGKHDGARGIAEQRQIDADTARETHLLRTVGGDRAAVWCAIVREQRKLRV